MPVKTHIEESQQLVDIAISSSRARSYEDSRNLLRSAFHLLLEEGMNRDLESRYHDLCIWKEIRPTQKRLSSWSDEYYGALAELRDNARFDGIVEAFVGMLEHGLVPESKLEECLKEMRLFIDEILSSLETTDDSQELLSTSGAAKMFGVTSQTVLTWCKEGRMPGAYPTPGGTWRIPRKSLAKIQQLLEASSDLDEYLPEQDAVNEAVSKGRRAWKK